MRKYLLPLLVLAFAASLPAQTAIPVLQGQIAATSADCTTAFSCVWQSGLPSLSYISTVSITGTFTATLLVQESNNGGQTWSTAATLSAAGTTTYAVNGFTDIRVRCSAYTSGTAVISINTGLAGAVGGGGGGAVTSVFSQVGVVPDLSGDAQTSGSSVVTVPKVNGNSVPPLAVAHQALICTGTSTCVWKTVPDCNGSTNALNYTQSTDVFSCLTIAALANPMTTLADLIYGGASGTPTRLAGPTATNGVPQFLQETPAANAAVAPVWAPAGVPTNAQTGTTYTVAATDRASYVSFSNAGAIAVTLPQAGTTGFASNFVMLGCDIGAGRATITPTTSTISWTDGTSYHAAQPNLPLDTGQCAWIYSNNADYFAVVRSGNASNSFPLTVSGTVNSGGIPCFTATTTESSSALLTTNVLTKGGGAGACPTNSLTTDDGTTRTYTGTGGDKAPVYTATGTTAGFWDFPQGTTSAAVAPCNVATSICEQAPTAVTSYLLVKPGAAPTVASYKQTDTCGSAVCTETFQPAPIVLAVTADFVTAANTNLQAITGLTFAGIGTKAFKARIECDVFYNQQTAAVADAFGIQDVTTAPNEIDASGMVQTAATTWVDSVLTALTTTTATNIVAMTPSAITTVWHAQLHALVDQPSGTASVVQIMVKTGTSADTVTVKRGSSCLVSFQ